MKLAETSPEKAGNAIIFPNSNGSSSIEEGELAGQGINGHEAELTTIPDQSPQESKDPLLTKIREGAEFPDFTREEMLKLSQMGLATGIMCRWQDKENARNGIVPRDPFEYTAGNRQFDKGERRVKKSNIL